MKKIIFLLISSLLLFSCNMKNNSAEISTIPYIIAEKYFVKNNETVNSPTEKVITTQEDFDKIFGATAHMGKNGTPTAIDFSKEQVIAIMLPVTNISTQIIPKKLEKTTPDEADFYYKIKSGEKLDFDTKPSALFIVSKEYKKIHFHKKD